MANRRMITKDIIENPKFDLLSIPSKYAFQIANLYADDEGYIRIKDLIYYSGCSESDLQNVSEAEFFCLQNGIIKVNNWEDLQEIKKDRFKPSILKEFFIGANKQECLQNVSKMSPQIRLEEIRLDKISIEKKGTRETHPLSKPEASINILKDQKTLNEFQNQFPNINVKFQAQKCLDWLEANGKSKKNYKAFFRNWLTSPYLDNTSKAPPPPKIIKQEMVGSQADLIL